MARAAYSRPEIVLLDDPLSALDAGTSKIIFENLKSLLSGSAIVLVTHAAHFLSQVDKIMLVSDGQVKFNGTWNDLLTFKPLDPKTSDAVEHIRQSVQEDASDPAQSGPDVRSSDRRNSTDGKNGGRASTLLSGKKIMTIEDREHGLSSLSTWLLWFKHAGGVYFIFVHIFFMAIDRFTYVAVEYWLARWTEGAYDSVNVMGIEFPAQSDGFSSQGKYVLVYSLLILASVVGTFLRSEWVGKFKSD